MPSRLFYLHLLLAAASAVSAANLNVTAITAKHGSSHFECWELEAPFESTVQPGIVGTQAALLGDVANITYNVIPSGFEAGFHTAPVPQWVIAIRGLAVIMLPDSDITTTIVGGERQGLLFAADTPDVSKQGHGNYFPGITDTVFVQVPTASGIVPKHKVLYQGPCTADEYEGP